MFGSLENFVGWSWKYFSHEADTEPFQLFQIVYIMFKSVMVPYVARVFQVRPPNRSIEIWFGFVWTASRSILTNFILVWVPAKISLRVTAKIVALQVLTFMILVPLMI